MTDILISNTTDMLTTSMTDMLITSMTDMLITNMTDTLITNMPKAYSAPQFRRNFLRVPFHTHAAVRQ